MYSSNLCWKILYLSQPLKSEKSTKFGRICVAKLERNVQTLTSRIDLTIIGKIYHLPTETNVKLRNDENSLYYFRGQRSKRPNTKPGSNPSSPIKPSIANKSKQAAAAELKSKKHLAFGTNGPLVPQLVTVPEKQQEGNEDKSKSGPPTNVAVTPEVEKTRKSQPETMRAVPPQTSDVTNSAPTPAEPAQTFKATVAQYPTTPAVTQSLLQLQEPPTIDAATQQTPNVTPAIPPPQQQQQPATTPAPYMGYFQPGNEGYGNPNWSSFTTDNQFNQQQFNPQQYNHNQYSGRPYGEEVGQVDFDRLKHLTGTDVNLLFGTDDTNNVGRPNAVEVLDDPSAALDNNGTSNLITLESVLVPSRGNPSGSSTASAASDASSRRSSNPSGSSSLSSKSVDIPLDWAQRFQSTYIAKINSIKFLSIFNNNSLNRHGGQSQSKHPDAPKHLQTVIWRKRRCHNVGWRVHQTQKLLGRGGLRRSHGSRGQIHSILPEIEGKGIFRIRGELTRFFINGAIRETYRGLFNFA
jgi:hypothetical protein